MTTPRNLAIKGIIPNERGGTANSPRSVMAEPEAWNGKVLSCKFVGNIQHEYPTPRNLCATQWTISAASVVLAGLGDRAGGIIKTPTEARQKAEPRKVSAFCLADITSGVPSSSSHGIGSSSPSPLGGRLHRRRCKFLSHFVCHLPVEPAVVAHRSDPPIHFLRRQ